jgi:chromosome segregation ATPase
VAVARLEEEARATAEAHRREVEEAARERREEVEQWRARLEQERGHWKEELGLIQEDRSIMITKLTEKDLALDELREKLELQQADAQQQALALKQALAAESAKVADAVKDKADSLGRARDKAREELAAAQAAHQKLADEAKTLKDEILAKVNALEAARTTTAKLQEQAHEQQALLAQRDKHADALQAQLQAAHDSLAASHKQANALNESLERAIEGRLDAEKQLHDALARHQELETRTAAERERLETRLAGLERQNADLEVSLRTQADAFRDERAQLEAGAAALREDLEARTTALADLEFQHATLAAAHTESEAAVRTLEAQLQQLVPTHHTRHDTHATHIPAARQLLTVATRATTDQRESLETEKARGEEELGRVREEKAIVAKELQELRQRFDDAELEKKIAERKSQQMVRCFPSFLRTLVTPFFYILYMYDM